MDPAIYAMFVERAKLLEMWEKSISLVDGQKTKVGTYPPLLTYTAK